jgi:alginate O-acetyltransferase complex protein AlgJ
VRDSVGKHVRQPSGAVRLGASASTPGGVVGPGTETGTGTAGSIPSPRPRGRRWLVLLVGLVFLFTPAAAYVSGVRATEIENRRLTAFPSVSAGWEFFPQLSAWATDHLPLRDRAVAANTRLSETVFGEPPQYGGPAEGGGAGPVAPAPGETEVEERVFPRVLQGKDGWLFLGADVSGACEPLLPLDETLAGLSRFGELVQRAGKEYVFTVAPDKSTMNPDKMPETYVGDDCAPEAKRAFWERMEDDPPVGYVDLKAELERVQEEDGENLWRPSDTHWAQRGGLVYAQKLAEALDPALWRTSRIVPTGPVQLQADLAAQLGTPRKDEVPGWRLEREGVTVTEERPTTLAATTTGAPLHTPPTLILGDSFTQSSLNLLSPLFASARIVQPATATDDPQALVSAILSSDTVVLEIVERSVVAGDVPIIDEAFLVTLEQALATTPPAP